jgi:hypothetical protein
VSCGVSSFSFRHEVKRLAYSLIGIGCLWIIGFASFSENPLTLREDPHYGPPEPVVVYATCGVIASAIGTTIAGWILSGPSIPCEGPAHRIIMTCIAGVSGTFIAAGLMIGIFGLRAWLFPGPPWPEKD